MFNKTTTIILYLFIVLTVYFFTCLGTKKKPRYYGLRIDSHIFCYSVGWFVASFFICCSDIGADYYSYISILSIIEWSNIFSFTDAEPGFKLIWLIYRCFSSNGDVFLFIIKLSGITLAFYSFWSMRNRLDLRLAVLGYMCFIYFDSFNLIRMIFAINICIYATSKFVDKSYKLSLAITLIACTIHTASILYLGALSCSYIYLKCKKIANITKYFIIGGIIFIIVFGRDLYYFLINNFHLFAHYSKYEFDMNMTFSPVIFIKFIPVVYLMMSFHLSDSSINKTFLILVSFAFLTVMLSYAIPILTRANVFFNIIQCLFIPILLYKNSNYDQKYMQKHLYSLKKRDIKVLVILYDIFFLFVKMLELSVSHIDIYKFIWM